jgi:hypothetical protein
MSASDSIPDRTGLCICLGGLAIALMLIPNAAGAVSFDCNRASVPVETTICSDARLSRLDGEWSSPGFVDSYGLADSSCSRILLS